MSSHTIVYLKDGAEVARAHAFLRSDGTIAASGKPDPKRVLVDRTLYVVERPN